MSHQDRIERPEATLAGVPVYGDWSGAELNPGFRHPLHPSGTGLRRVYGVSGVLSIGISPATNEDHGALRSGRTLNPARRTPVRMPIVRAADRRCSPGWSKVPGVQERAPAGVATAVFMEGSGRASRSE